MWHIILQILAVIGILILCILGLFLVLLAMVLFVPIRYRAQGCGSKDDKSYALKVKVTYLLHILTLRYELPKPGELEVRLFGIRIFPKKGSAEKNVEAEKTERENVETEDAEAGTAEKSDDTKQITAGDSGTFTEPTIEQTESNKEVSTEKQQPEKSTETETEAEAADEPEISFLRHPILWIRQKAEKCIYTIRSICDKIKNIAETVTYYKEVITKKENTAFYKRVKKQVFKLLKSIRPRKLVADLRIGTGSPDTTGYLCAVYGMLLPLLGKHVNITADFEEAVVEGDFFVKGRITVFSVLYHGAKVAFDKQLKIFIKELKREDLNNGRKPV